MNTISTCTSNIHPIYKGRICTSWGSSESKAKENTNTEKEGRHFIMQENTKTFALFNAILEISSMAQ